VVKNYCIRAINVRLLQQPLHCADLGHQPARRGSAGAPAALLFGWLSDKVNRKRLLFAAVVLGALAWRDQLHAFALLWALHHCTNIN
jgi:hypothetical protein